MRNSTSLRGLSRTTMHNSMQGGDHSEHPLSSLARERQEGVSTVGGDGSSVPGGSTFRAAGGGHRRTTSEIASPQSDNIADRNQTSHARDQLWRSRDTNLSDTPRLAERGGHGRDSPVIPRDPTAAGTGGGGAASRAVPPLDRERSPGSRIGDEDLPIEVPGRYERMRVLGRGSFGAVTLVKDSRDSKLYAMKTLNVGERPEERVAAVEEVRLLRRLKHPSLLTLFDTFLSPDGRLMCLTTNYCESGDLAKIIKHAAKRKSPLGEKTVLGWFAQLCMGVHHLHEEKRVIHRDIKPNNVFLMDSKKIIQLGDFGLAKVINNSDKEVKTEVGTPYYTSPEMCNNQPYGFPSDVWSLGIVLFELLALEVPFRSRDVVVLVSQVIKALPPPLPDTYSGEATTLARWMLQKDPLRRPTLTQALACQPLRRHMTSFVKNYRPMNMAERQRRQDIKDLEAQVAIIIERGGDDPQIPSDVDEGCGTFPVSAKQETTEDDAKNHKMEAREDEEERARTAGEGAEGAVEGGGLGRMIPAYGTEKSPILAGKMHVGTLAASKADADEAKGVCNRCGARFVCACAGGDNAGSGLAVGVGNTTPGRRFGSPQQSKGARNVMSWTTRGAIPVDNDQDGGGDGDRDHGPSWSDGESCCRRRRSSNNGGSGSRERRLTAEGSVEDNSEGRGGVTAGDAGVNEQCTRGGSGDIKRTTSREVGTLDDENGDRVGVSEGETNAGSEGSADTPAPNEASLPPSTRSPGPPESSARLKHVSGSSSNGGAGCCSNENLLKGEERHSVTIPKNDRRSEGRINVSEQAKRGRNRDGSGGAGAFQATGTLEGIQAGRGTVADSEREARVQITRRKATQQEEEYSLPTATAADGVTAIGATGGIRSSTAAEDETMEGTTDVTGFALEAERYRTQNEPGASPQSSRSPRLPETSKTAKRLSEALTYAAGDLGP